MVRLSERGRDEIQQILLASHDEIAPALVFGATSAKEELGFISSGLRTFGDPSGGPVDENSIFWICSQTKMLASIAIFQLIEAGKLTLDTDVTTILPELSNPVVMDGKFNFKPSQTKITIRHLLNHTNGLDYGSANDRPSQIHLPTPYISEHNDLSPITHFLRHRRGLYPTQLLKFEPGTNWAYSYGPDCLGFIVERITGQTLEQYHKTHIFTPLGMRTASFYLTDDLKNKLVSLTFQEPDGKIVAWDDQYPIIVQDPKHVHVHMSGIGLYCSMKDYLTLLRHMLQILDGTAVNPILQAKSLRTFFEPTLPPQGAMELDKWLAFFKHPWAKGHQWGTALCINTIDLPGRRRKGSGFWFGWAGTYHFIDPETGVALIFGSQTVPSLPVTTLWSKVEEIFYRNLLVDSNL